MTHEKPFIAILYFFRTERRLKQNDKRTKLPLLMLIVRGHVSSCHTGEGGTRFVELVW